MKPLFETTIYCCASCGTDFEFSEWVEEESSKLMHEPVLSCPKCKGPAFRVERGERDVMKEFLRLETKVLELVFARVAEAEGLSDGER